MLNVLTETFKTCFIEPTLKLMNQDSLSKYKSQVYNPGSPHPSPVTEPFKGFPKTQTYSSAASDPVNPLKITFSAKRKRQSNNEPNSPSKSPAKKLKMISKEDADEFFKKLSKQFEETQEKVNSGIRDDMGDIRNELKSIRTAQIKANEDDKKEKDSFKEQFKTIESRLEKLESSHAPESSNPPSPNFLNPSSDTTWKANLAKDVFIHDHGIIIHGIKLEGNDDTSRANHIKDFFKNEMKAPNDLLTKIRIKEVTRLGQESETKPPPQF